MYFGCLVLYGLLKLIYLYRVKLPTFYRRRLR